MRLLKLPNEVHQCLIYSVAMLLDCKPENIINSLGHDGCEIWWPELEAPWSYRGVHMQEILDVVELVGKTLVCYQLMPMSVPIGDGLEQKTIYTPQQAMMRFTNAVRLSEGLLITDRHACAWDGKKVYDPNGRIADISDYPIKEFWRLL